MILSIHKAYTISGLSIHKAYTNNVFVQAYVYVGWSSVLRCYKPFVMSLQKDCNTITKGL